jgi:hypothetical protein
MSRRFPDFARPHPKPWSRVDTFLAGLVATIMLSFIGGATALLMLMPRIK